jgi:ectoine hydroxylase-related dioxygenase (phytanoyl-CoA dioxygenase family)
MKYWNKNGVKAHTVESDSMNAQGCATTSKPSFAREGYAVLQQFLSKAEVAQLRRLITSNYDGVPWHSFRTQRQARNTSGTRTKCAVDLVGRHSAYQSLLPVTEVPLRKPALHRELHRAFNGTSYLFADASEVMINQSTEWHRDVLHGEDKLQYKHPDLWSVDERSGARYGMARLVVYLQSYTYNGSEGALHVHPSSHRRYGWKKRCNKQACNLTMGQLHERPVGLEPTQPHILRPSAGDAVLFDMRLLHKDRFDEGLVTHRERSGAADHISIQLAFGLRNNVFTEEWREGDRRRRSRFLSSMGVKGSTAACPADCVLSETLLEHNSLFDSTGRSPLGEGVGL